MVKLIRIVSEDNCNFNANLDAGIKLGENSSIALQNLTFENKYATLSINNSNRIIEFNLDTNDNQSNIPDLPGQPTPPFLTINKKLSVGDYNKDNYKDFYEDLQATLNNTLSVEYNVESQDIYSSFLIDYITNPNRPTIKYKYSPLSLLFNRNTIDERQEDYDKLFEISEGSVLDISDDITDNFSNFNNITNPGEPTQLLEHYIYPISEVGQWCKGSAFFGCSVYNNVNNADEADTNGFGIGLSFTDIQVEAEKYRFREFEDKWRDFEILIEKSDETYRFISPETLHVEQTPLPPLLPYKVNITTDIDSRTHDRIVFQRNNGKITGSIWNTSVAGGNITPLFSYTIPFADINKPIYPYIYVKGDSTTTTIGRPVFTPNTIAFDYDDDTQVETNAEFEISGRQNYIGLRNTIDGKNWFEDIDIMGGFQDVVPKLNNARLDRNISFPEQNIRLSLNPDIWNFLGFDRTQSIIQSPYTDPNVGQFPPGGIAGFNLIGNRDVELIYSDNFVVVLDSNPLESYDASMFDYSTKLNRSKFPNQMRGRRLNILATIADNDNTGYLEFKAEVPTFIDLDNRFKQELKNIKIRVLDKDLNPITTLGKSILTILIDSK